MPAATSPACSSARCGGVEKETLLSHDYCPVAGLWEREPLAGEIARVAGRSLAERDPPEIQGSGYVVRSLEAALWSFSRARDFREGGVPILSRVAGS